MTGRSVGAIGFVARSYGEIGARSNRAAGSARLSLEVMSPPDATRVARFLFCPNRREADAEK